MMRIHLNANPSPSRGLWWIDAKGKVMGKFIRIDFQERQEQTIEKYNDYPSLKSSPYGERWRPNHREAKP